MIWQPDRHTVRSYRAAARRRGYHIGPQATVAGRTLQSKQRNRFQSAEQVWYIPWTGGLATPSVLEESPPLLILVQVEIAV